MKSRVRNRSATQAIVPVPRALTMAVIGMLSGVLFSSGWTYAQAEAPAQSGVASSNKPADTAEAQIAKGRELLKAKKNQEALEAFEKATALDPANDKGWDGQWDALNALNRKADALAMLDKWGASQPRNPQAWTYKMMMNGIAGRPAEALKACDQLIELDPANGDYYMGRGEMLRCLGRKDEALVAYEKAAALSKNPIVRGSACRGLAELLSQQGKHAEVIAACNRGIESYPATVDKDAVAHLWYRRAAARALTGDTANALTDLKTAIELNLDLKGQAVKDAAFKALQDNAEFKSLTK